MDTYQTIQKKEIAGSFDVIVAGGGIAGVMAAVSAAREGMKVLLVEKYGFLGGMATAGLVNPYMSWVERGSGAPANSGLFELLQKRTFELGGAKDVRSGSFMDEFLKIVLDRFTKEYGIKVLFHSKVCDVDRSGNCINGITVATTSGMLKLSAKVFIDATGNADLSAFAGLEYKLGRDEDGLCQPMTLCFRLANVDWSRYNRSEVNALYNQLQKNGRILNPRENILAFSFPVKNIMHLNTTRIVGKNPVDVEDVTDAEMTAREQVFEMYRFLKEHAAGLENCELIYSAAETGIRESRRVIGRYEITKDDILCARKFDDRIARGTYDIDIHNPSGSGTVIEHVPTNDYYTIPYRALVPCGVDNLIVAGRPISSTHEAHSSFRVMPITTCIGEAAGAACALAVAEDCSFIDISIQNLQDILVAKGALI